MRNYNDTNTACCAPTGQRKETEIRGMENTNGKYRVKNIKGGGDRKAERINSARNTMF